MRRTAVRQSPSSLRLWCLSMLNTHSMIQNIWKYRTVIIDLQNTHPHVLGIYILHVFHSRGSPLPWRENCLRHIVFCLHNLTHDACWSCCLLFYTVQRWHGRTNNQSASLPLYQTKTPMVCLHINTHTFSQLTKDVIQKPVSNRFSV